MIWYDYDIYKETYACLVSDKVNFAHLLHKTVEHLSNWMNSFTNC